MIIRNPLMKNGMMLVINVASTSIKSLLYEAVNRELLKVISVWRRYS
jgi:hypothetical protein